MLLPLITLLYAKMCPLCHSDWLTAFEKNVPLNHYEVNLTDPDQFSIDTYSKAFAHEPQLELGVPVLIHREHVFAQGELIAWYIAQTFKTGTELIPQDTYERVKMRRFMTNLVDVLHQMFFGFEGYSSKSEQQKQAIKDYIAFFFEGINGQIKGPYVLGDSVSLADLMLYPWLERWSVITHYFGVSIPTKYSKIYELLEAMQKRDSVKKTKREVTNQTYIDGYAKYFTK